MSEPMPYEIRERLFKLRCKSKRGDMPTGDEMDFLEDCFKRWPAEYEAMGKEVFNATAPFGARVLP